METKYDDITAYSDLSSTKSYDCRTDKHSSRKKRPAASQDGGPGARMLFPDMWVDVRAQREYSKFFSYVSCGRVIQARSVGMCTIGMMG